MASNLSRVLSGMDETVITATNQVITVDPDTRQLNIPGIELVFGVEGDGSSERKYFQFPRYVGDKLDLAGSFLRVNYRNANGDKDSYLVDDVTVEDDSIVFSWLVSEKVVAYKGQVRFVICAVGPDLKVKWHTTLGAGISSEGLEPDTDIVAGTEDVIAQLIAMVEAQTEAVETVGETWVENVKSEGAKWVADVKSEGATQVAAVKTAAEDAEAASVAEIEAKGVNTRNSIPEDYTALSEAVDKLDRTRGAAIVCEAAGETVVIGDSSNLPMQGLRVFGKTTQVTTTGAQMFDKNAAVVGMLEEDGSITADGAYVTSDFIPITPKTAYHQTKKDSIRAKYYDADKNPLSETWDVQIVEDSTFTTFERAHFIRLTVSVKLVDSFMLNLGIEGLPYEPYSGGKPSPSPDYPQELVSLEPVVEVYGNNFANALSIETGANSSAIASEDGYVITCVGGADKPYTSSPIYLPMEMLRGKTVILKADSITNSQDSSGKGGNVQLNIRDSEKMKYVAISPNNLMAVTTIPEDATRVDLNIYTNNSATLFEAENTTVVKGLRLLVADGEWEAYRLPQTVELTHILPGIPVASGGNYTDSDGQQWICDEVDFERGVYVQRIHRIVCDGVSEKWFFTSETVYLAPLQDNPYIGNNAYRCSHYTYGVKDNGFWFGNALNIKDATHYTSSDAWVAWITEQYAAGTPLTFHYGLKTPVETALSETEIAAYRALHSNYPNTTVLNDSGAHMVVKYAADTKLYIDNKIKEALA